MKVLLHTIPVRSGFPTPVVAVSSPLSEGINPDLSEETVMASPEAIAKKAMLVLLITHPHYPSLLLDL